MARGYTLLQVRPGREQGNNGPESRCKITIPFDPFRTREIMPLPIPLLHCPRSAASERRVRLSETLHHFVLAISVTKRPSRRRIASHPFLEDRYDTSHSALGRPGPWLFSRNGVSERTAGRC